MASDIGSEIIDERVDEDRKQEVVNIAKELCALKGVTLVVDPYQLRSKLRVLLAALLETEE